MSLPAPLLTLLHPLIEDTPHRHQVAEFIVLLVKGGETQKKIEEELAGTRFLQHHFLVLACMMNGG